MHSASGRKVLVFNGEIYNYRTLRHELEQLGHRFRGHSDSEALVEALDEWGLEGTLSRITGMFAFALWDRDKRTLSLARDRMGEKPLYYGRAGAAFVFGSELCALRAFPGFEPNIDRGALTLLMRYAYVPAPHSIYEGVRKLLPGTSLTISWPQTLDMPEPSPYWSVRHEAEVGLREPWAASERETIDELEQRLSRAISGQMLADVPLGAFLSGGIDSSTVVALMQAQSSAPVKTFTIGFRESGYNEAEHAAAVARHLGTEHTELYVSPDEALSVIDQLPSLYNEPFADSSQIPTYLVARMARHHVTVALSGDGGDELFGGYNRYLLGDKFWNLVRWAPAPMRHALARGLTLMSPAMGNHLGERLMAPLPSRMRVALLGEKLHKLAGVMDSQSADDLYFKLVSACRTPEQFVQHASEPPTRITSKHDHWQPREFVDRMMLADMLTYLPDDILVKVDRAAMGVSLETRVPMLDHELVEFAWRVPLHMKIRDGQSKWLLRQVLHRHVPRQLIERPKMGFGIPLDQWLRGPLRVWAEDLLEPSRLGQEGYFHAEPILEKWREHLSGHRNWQYLLWPVLMFQAWLRVQ